MYNSRKYNSDMISSGGDTDSESDSNFNDCEEEIDINDLENIRIQTNIPISLDEDKFETISEFFFISVDSKDRLYLSGDTNFNYSINSLGQVYKNVASFTIEGIVLPNLYLDPLKVHGLYKDSIVSSSSSSDSKVIRTRRI